MWVRADMTQPDPEPFLLDANLGLFLATFAAGDWCVRSAPALPAAASPGTARV